MRPIFLSGLSSYPAYLLIMPYSMKASTSLVLMRPPEACLNAPKSLSICMFVNLCASTNALQPRSSECGGSALNGTEAAKIFTTFSVQAASLQQDGLSQISSFHDLVTNHTMGLIIITTTPSLPNHLEISILNRM